MHATCAPQLELALTTDELAAAQASVRELSAALETAQARALAERDAVQHELDMERARASALGRRPTLQPPQRRTPAPQHALAT